MFQLSTFQAVPVHDHFQRAVQRFGDVLRRGNEYASDNNKVIPAFLPFMKFRCLHKSSDPFRRLHILNNQGWLVGVTLS